jgi:hypothetical protein
VLLLLGAPLTRFMPFKAPIDKRLAALNDPFHVIIKWKFGLSTTQICAVNKFLEGLCPGLLRFSPTWIAYLALVLPF